MKRTPIPTGHIQVGKTLEVTATEAATIQSHVHAMEIATRKMKAGWLTETVLHHNAISKLLWRMIERSHES